MNYFEFSNLYYRTFRSYYPYVRPFDFRVVVFVVSGFLFFYFGAQSLPDINGFVSSYKFLLLMLSESVFVISSLVLSDYRDKVAVGFINDNYGWRCIDIDGAKRRFLGKFLGISDVSFYSAAKSIDEAFELHKKYRPVFAFSLDVVFEFLFSRDSKPRILALFIFLSSAFIVVLSKDEGARFVVFDIYDSLSWRLAVYYFLIVFAFFLSWICLGLVFQSVKQFLYLIAWRTGGKTYVNENIVGYVVRDLVRLSFKKYDVQDVKFCNLKRSRVR